MSRKKRMIGLQVISARHLLGLTQDELADKADVSSGKVKNIEGCKYKESGYAEFSNMVEDCLMDMGIEFYEDDKKIGIMISKKKLKKMERKENKK